MEPNEVGPKETANLIKLRSEIGAIDSGKGPVT